MVARPLSLLLGFCSLTVINSCSQIEVSHQEPNPKSVKRISQEFVYTWNGRESLEAMAARYGLTKADILESNRLTSETQLFKGKKLFVPLHLAEAAKKFNRKYLESLIWPVRGPISSNFGWRGKKFHSGLDIRAPKNAPVRTVLNGVVSFAGQFAGYGNVIVITHSPHLVTLYSHNTKNLVKKGDRVFKDQVIGLVGNTGDANGYHLHFEVRIAGEAVDPVYYLKNEVYDYAGVLQSSSTTSAN